MTDSEPKPTKRKAPMLLRFSQLWLVAIVLLLGLDWFSQSFDPGWLTRTYFAATVIMSLVAFVYFGIDKRRANLDKHRISERQLHLMAFFGGWPGAVMGQQMFRHKTSRCHSASSCGPSSPAMWPHPHGSSTEASPREPARRQLWLWPTLPTCSDP